jgi:hypothetical protein
VRKYIFDDHDEEGEFDAQGFLFVLRTGYEGCGDIGAHDFEDRRLDVLVSEALDVSIVNCIDPKLLCLSQICRGLLPIEYRIDRNPDW